MKQNAPWSEGHPVDADEAEVAIAANPWTVYGIVSDVTGTARHSPECRQVEWLDGYTDAVPGARFRGRNRWRGFAWWREAIVTDARPGERFAFETIPARGINKSRTVWTYEMSATPSGQTLLRQRFHFYAPRRVALMDAALGRPRALRWNVKASLAAVKRLAEDSAAARADV